MIWIIAGFFVNCYAQNVTVDIKYGRVQGHVVTLGTGQQVVSYLGIPYGKAPVGNLRFRAPEEPEPWTETFIADRFGNSCPHQYGSYTEDCLNLNVFTPHNYSSGGPYPVYVYIHGGAYQYNSNFFGVGHFYAARGVVFVGPNYRLGTMGFMSSGDAASRGNYGMLDQRLALQFIQENIGRFSGDPNKVTIGGHSAGAFSVGLHLVSPLSQGLFHQAMLLSGSDLGTMSVNPPDMAVNFTHQVANQLSCPVQDSQAMMGCLRSKTVQEIVHANINFYRNTFLPTYGHVPTVDGPRGFLPEMPIDLRNKGQFAKVPILAGVTDKEQSGAYAWAPNGFNSSDFRRRIDVHARWETGYYGDASVRAVSAAMVFQYTPWPQTENRTVNRDQLIEVLNDIMYHGPVDRTLRFHAEHNDTYQYVFGYRSRRATTPEWRGVQHAQDRLYFQGFILLEDHPEVAADMNRTPPAADQRDKDYANYWIDLFTNFIKHGKPTLEPHPSPPGHPPTMWHPRTPQQLNYLSLYNASISIKQDFKQSNNAFWREYVPWIINRTRTREET